MRHPISRAFAAALAGALAGLVCLWVALGTQGEIAWEMDRDLTTLSSGFYPVERERDLTFAWTTGAASFRLEGARRVAPWVCVVRLRGARPAGHAQPFVRIASDDLVAAAFEASNVYQDVTVPVPARRGRDGLTLSIAADPVMVPGPTDARPLGVQVDRLSCRPESTGLLALPRRALLAAAVSAGGFGGAAVVLGLGLPAAFLMAIGLAVAQAYPLSAGVGPYSSYPLAAAWFGLAVALVMALVGTIARWRGRPLHPAAAWAVAFAAGAALLELLGLAHPAKLPVDVVFHAHRLEWVLAGRYFFTQPMPDGVRFPYAIALYVVAAPWARLTSDYVDLLRLVVVTVRAGAAVAMYPLVRRAGGDRVTASVSTVLVYLVPVAYLNIGNANLTFVFGQSVAMLVLAASVAWRVDRRPLAGLGLFALCALAFLSHVGVFPVLLTALLALSVLYWGSGGDDRRAAVVLVIVALCAAAFSVVVYYGRFAEAYQSLERVTTRAVSSVATPGGDAGTSAAGSTPAGRSLLERVANAVSRGVLAVGWPLAVLASLGAWRAWRGRARDRVVLAASAVTAAYLVFLASAVAAPVEPRFQRYTDEFIDRLSWLASPVAVLLAARGVTWLRGAGVVPRLASWALLVAAAWLAAGRWMDWLR